MSLNRPHHILHRMVPLICQAMTTRPHDETVWIEGLSMLCNTKLHRSMALTCSIWLALLIRGLEPSQPAGIIVAALKLLGEMQRTLEPMKSCLIKPLTALTKTEGLEADIMDSVVEVVSRFGLVIAGPGRQVYHAGSITGHSAQTTPLPTITPQPPAPPDPRKQPLLAEILNRNLPLRPRSVRHAWNQTLLSIPHENSEVWLHNLFQATLEASAVSEMVITSRLGPLVHGELFQTAFLKCYEQIGDDRAFKDSVDAALVRLLSDNSVARDILTVFLDLVAFFNKEKKQFPPAVLESAKRCALTKFRGELHQGVPGIVLWYAEQQTAEAISAQAIADNLVDINIRIGGSGYDSAWSSLLWLRDDYGVHPKPMWLTHLSHWDTAIKRQNYLDGEGGVKSFESFNTRMICYHALGQFENGYNLAQSLFEGLNDHERRKTAHWMTAAAWHMGDFDTMADYVAFHPKGTSRSLYKAIIDVHSGDYASAFSHIAKAQSLSYDELQTQLSVGPSIAIKTLAKTEVLVELEEVIKFKTQPDSRDHILRLWRQRFKRSHADANSWMKRLQVWTLACPATTIQLQNCFLDCAKLCESSGMHAAARRIIEWVTPEVYPPGCKVEYTQLRFDWKDATSAGDTTRCRQLYNQLSSHVAVLLDDLGMDRVALESEGLGLRPLSCRPHIPIKTQHILARRFYRLAQWKELIQGDDWVNDPENEVYRHYSVAYKLDDLWYNCSYSLSQAAMNIFETNGHSRTDQVAVNNYVVPAIRGLFQSVRSRETPEKMIKALLRLVTLWFRYGEAESVLVEVEHQLTETAISAWLMAIPQLIARLGTRHKELQGLLINLLKNISSQYPHAVIWPLLTASQTQKPEHEHAARVIMDFICTMPDGTKLVQQAQLVGKELIRTSISWMEKWRNIIDKCLPRQELMEIAWHEVPIIWEEEIYLLGLPETPDEEQFVQQYGPAIRSIYKLLCKYRATQSLGLVNTAYADLYKLYHDIEAQLSGWKMPGSKIQLANTAPRLLSVRDCLLTVPGQYDHNLKLDDQSFIASFHPVVDILSSKQLPRKLVISSYDEDFTFLLKGNEDLRGDERIMQLFTLINTLLNHESEAFGRNLHLLPYEVIPLSPSAGLIGWVTNTQQLQAMISANRERNKEIGLMHRELACLLGYDPETFDPRHDRPRLDPPAEMDKYDKLDLETKIGRLQNALALSKQSDLKDILWQRSPSADVWIRRRTNFARTIGVGSFVGHVIGLGDRHGSNILVDQLTWGALHIDFGDLFGAAQERAVLPEKVPFRLTRMMTNSFELACVAGHKVPGSRGSFKQASIVTMRVLRDSRSSLLAMLEAFLYDPLLSWTTASSPSGSASVARAGSASTGTSQTLAHGRPPRPVTYAAQSLALAKPQNLVEGGHDDDVEDRVLDEYLLGDSYMAKASHGAAGMTNRKALQVLAGIERKLSGYQGAAGDGQEPVEVKKQVQELIEEATDIRNLAQGFVLGWMPHW